MRGYTTKTEGEYSTNPLAIKSREQYKNLTEEQKQAWFKRSMEYRKRKKSTEEGKKLYSKMVSISQKKTKAKIPEGLCKQAISCKKPVIGESIFCLKHWIASISRAYKNNKNRQEKIDKLVVLEIWNEQKGLCSITGVPLVPGKNTSLDHIIPVSKGGTNNKSNLRFVHSAINLFKRDNEEQEFKEMILDLAPKLINWASKVGN